MSICKSITLSTLVKTKINRCEGGKVMKNVLDIYLKKKGITRSELSKKEELSEQKLARISKQNPDSYSEETLELLAKGLATTPAEVLEELRSIRDSDALYQVTNINELRQKVKEKEEEFLVEGDFRELLKEIEGSRVSETAELGFQLGSGGSGTVLAQAVLRVMNFFEEDTKLENLKQDIAQLYTIEFINEEEAKLRLKQLDY